MKPLLSAPLYGKPLTLPTNIRLGCQGLSGTKTLELITKIRKLRPLKVFVILAPGLIKDPTIWLYGARPPPLSPIMVSKNSKFDQL